MPTQKLFDYLSGIDPNLKVILSANEDTAIFEIILDDLEKTGEDRANEIFGMFEDLMMSNNKSFLKDVQGLFKLTFADFNSDPKALYDIKEVRMWVGKLIQKIPYLFYFFHPDTILLFAMCTLNYTEKNGYGTFNDDSVALSNFLSEHFLYLNTLTEEAGFTSEEEDRISKAIVDKFGLEK